MNKLNAAEPEKAFGSRRPFYPENRKIVPFRKRGETDSRKKRRRKSPAGTERLCEREGLPRQAVTSPMRESGQHGIPCKCHHKDARNGWLRGTLQRCSPSFLPAGFGKGLSPVSSHLRAFLPRRGPVGRSPANGCKNLHRSRPDTIPPGSRACRIAPRHSALFLSPCGDGRRYSGSTSVATPFSGPVFNRQARRIKNTHPSRTHARRMHHFFGHACQLNSHSLHYQFSHRDVAQFTRHFRRRDPHLCTGAN